MEGVRGERCARCLQLGMLVTDRTNGEALDESDRCPGCGNVVCDRHVAPPIREDRHALIDHVLAVDTSG